MKPQTEVSGFNNGSAAAILSAEVDLKKLRLGNPTVILLAEDEPLVRSMIRNVLASSGYFVLDAADGLQAVQLARSYEGKIDLLLTDLKMPNLNGAEAAKIIANERPGIGVLVISGHASDEIRKELESQPFLRKPFVPGVLLRRIREVLEP
jgi:CheY-like chemotaxis protein